MSLLLILSRVLPKQAKNIHADLHFDQVRKDTGHGVGPTEELKVNGMPAPLVPLHL